MTHITKIKVINQTYVSNSLPIGFEFECGDVNLLVGNQGCGKSTMLNLIQKNHADVEISLTDDVYKNGVDSFYFDSEKDNPRINNPERYADLHGNNIGIGYGGALSARFKSHGEIMEGFTVEPLKKAKNCVVILDEPESGLSITNQFKLIEEIKNAVKRGCQFFIATHCYPIIQEFDVISLEHLEKYTGTQFIELVK